MPAPAARRALTTAGCLALAAAAALAGHAPAASATPATTVTLPGHVLGDLASFTAGPVDLHRQATVGLVLEGRNPAGLQALLHAQKDPASPEYKHFLDPATFAARFGAPHAATESAASWLRAGGLTLDYSGTAGTYVHAAGTVAQLQQRFGVTFHHYTGRGLDFTAADANPTVPAGLGIKAVAGLNDRGRMHRDASALPAAFPVSAETTASDLWSIYDQPSDDIGQGQALTVFGWGYDDGHTIASDLAKFEDTYLKPTYPTRPHIPFTIRHLGATDPDSANDGLGEWNIDTQASVGMAPGARKLTMYMANAGVTDQLAALVSAWADDPQGGLQASGSFGGCEALDGVLGGLTAHDAALTQAEVEGRTAFYSTGDTGSGCIAGVPVNVNGVVISPIASQEYPATSPHAVAVGGTVVTTTSATPPKRDIEYAWTHTGGGTSLIEPKPDYQVGVPGIIGQCLIDADANPLVPPVPCRGVPDVAAQSGDLLSDFKIISAGADGFGGGTSLSAPLMQGMWSRVSAAAPLSADGHAVGAGFANTTFYALGKNATTNPQAFYDITVGANGTYAATAGWDYVSGWGVPDMKKLIQLADGGTTPTDPDGSRIAPLSTTPDTVPVCASGTALTDPTGDVTDVSGQPATTGDADITGATYSWDEATQTLSATVSIVGYDDVLESGSLGRDVVAGFTIGGDPYSLEYDHHAADPLGGGTAETRRFFVSAGSSDLGVVPGSVDTVAHTVTLSLPAAKLADPTSHVSPLTDGTRIADTTVETREFISTGYYGLDDAQQAVPCRFAAADAASIAPTPAVPETPFATLLPISALGLCLGGVAVLRRRRRSAI